MEEAKAGSISITTQTSARVEAGRLIGSLQITNRGDEKAYQVRADVETLGERFGTAVQPTVGPGESKGFQFDASVQTPKKGSYPMTVLIHFQDANGYPFTALTCTTFFLGERVDADLTSTAAPLTIKDHGVLSFNIRNPGHDPRKVRTTLHLPQEFSSEVRVSDILLMPGDRKTLSIPIRNLSALYGATYPVFLTQEYDYGGTHFALSTTAMVGIVRDGNWFRETRWHWAGGMALLVGLFVIVAAKSRTTGKLVDILKANGIDRTFNSCS